MTIRWVSFDIFRNGSDRGELPMFNRLVYVQLAALPLKRTIVPFLLSALLCAAPALSAEILSSAGPDVAFAEAKPANPIMRGADPHALLIGGTFWIYPTWSERGQQQFFAFSSTNLAQWERHGPILDFRDVPWIKADGATAHYAWAPAMFPWNGKFYLFYSVGPQHPTPARIGVAVGDSPGGRFIDSGKPLVTGWEGFEAIDPMVFRDPRSKAILLYVGGSAGAKMRVFELGSDLTTLRREIPVETPKEFTEGVFMHFHAGRYYLSYSHGGWRDSSYSVHYSSSDSPFGPWTYHGAILTSDATRKGPGHHSFWQDPEADRGLIFYHRWENQRGDGPYRGSRQICIDRFEYDAEGLIRPIIMTSVEAKPADRAVSPSKPAGVGEIK